MSVNTTERIALALSLCSDLIESFETLWSDNPNLAKFKVVFTDGSRLQVSEDWRGDALYAYSYYWLDSSSRLIIGWDNSKHHPQLENFPHHKHVRKQEHRKPSSETSLEDVLTFIRQKLTS